MNPPVSEAAAEALREPARLPIFVARDGRRRRVLRLVGRVVAGLTALWLVALLAGALGLGHLPGIALPQSGSGEAAKSPSAPTSARAHHGGATSHGHAAKQASGHSKASSSHPSKSAGSGNGGSASGTGLE